MYPESRYIGESEPFQTALIGIEIGVLPDSLLHILFGLTEPLSNTGMSET